MPISSRFFVQSTTALLLVGFLALLGIVGMTFWLGERAQVYFNEVIAARDARSAAVDLRNAVQTAESSQRGFLYTGNEVYLASYGPAKTLAERQLAAVNRLLASYEGASASLPRLTAVINEKFAEMDLTIAMKREYRDADALARDPHQSRQGADGRSQYILRRHHQRHRRTPDHRRRRAEGECDPAPAVLDHQRHRDRHRDRHRRGHRRALHARTAPRADGGERAERRPGAARRSPHRRSGARQRRYPALRPDHLARPSRAAGQHRRLHRRTRG